MSLSNANANGKGTDLGALSKTGQHTLSWMFWDVYDITLLTPEGFFDPEDTYALKLEYKMSFTGEEIADRSAEEMRGQNAGSEVQIATWHTQMNDVFPDIEKGDSLTGYVSEEKHSVFLHNGKEIGIIKDPKFTDAFFNIWLGKNTSIPKMREALLVNK